MFSYYIRYAVCQCNPETFIVIYRCRNGVVCLGYWTAQGTTGRNTWTKRPICDLALISSMQLRFFGVFDEAFVLCRVSCL